MVDTAERIEEMLPILDEMADEGSMTMQDVQVVSYTAPVDPD